MAFIGKKPTDAPLTSSDVADGIITNAKLAQDIISGDTALASEPADTDEFLVSDAGVIKRLDYSYIKGETNTPYFQVSRQSSYHSVRYTVEGYDAKQLNCGNSSAKTVTLSFYVKCFKFWYKFLVYIDSTITKAEDTKCTRYYCFLFFSPKMAETRISFTQKN